MPNNQVIDVYQIRNLVPQLQALKLLGTQDGSGNPVFPYLTVGSTTSGTTGTILLVGDTSTWKFQSFATTGNLVLETGANSQFIFYPNGNFTANLSGSVATFASIQTNGGAITAGNIKATNFSPSGSNFNAVTLYGQTVTGNPAYSGTQYTWELGGPGLIIDGCLNVCTISMQATKTGYSGICLDNSDTQSGWIQWGKTTQTGLARIANIVSGGNPGSGGVTVLAVQTYVGGTGGHINGNTYVPGGGYAWDLGALDVSLLFCDHINSASGQGIYMFDTLRLWGPSGGHYLYDATNAAGTPGYVLTVNSSGFPVWSPSGSGGSSGVTGYLHVNGKQLLDSANNIVRLNGVWYSTWVYDATTIKLSDFQAVASNGGNVIRINEIPWGLLETSQPTTLSSPTSANFSSVELATMDQIAAWASSTHVYVVFAGGLDVASGYAGNGESWQIPSWCPGYTGTQTTDETGFYNSGNSSYNNMRTAFQGYMSFLAGRYAANPFVVWEPFNEPFNGNTPNSDTTAEYASVHAAINTAIWNAGYANPIIIAQPWIGFSGLTSLGQSNVIWDCHAYWVNGNTYSTWTNFIAICESTIVSALGNPVVFGEWSFVDSSYYITTLPAWATVQSNLSTQIAYLNASSGCVGACWYNYSELYGEPYNTSPPNPYSSADSTWALANVMVGGTGVPTLGSGGGGGSGSWNGGTVTNPIALGANIVSSPVEPVWLSFPNSGGVGFDTYGNLIPSAPGAVSTGNYWRVNDKNYTECFVTYIDGTRVIKTANNILDDGSGNMTITGVFSGSVAWSHLTSVPTSFTPAPHAATHLTTGSDSIYDQDLHQSATVHFGGITTGSITFSGVSGSNLTSWSFSHGIFASVYGVTTSGDLNVPNNLWLAGAAIFNPASSNYVYLIWDNLATLGLLCDSDYGSFGVQYYYNPAGSPRFRATYASGYTQYYLGALDAGAIFTKYLNPIGGGTVTCGGNLSLTSGSLLSTPSMATTNPSLATTGPWSFNSTYGPWTSNRVFYLYTQSQGAGEGFAVKISPDGSTWYTTAQTNGYASTGVVSATIIVPAGYYITIVSVGGQTNTVNVTTHLL